jgi:phosphatidylglycerol:prolipoprotein diacylglycerol transferase
VQNSSAQTINHWFAYPNLDPVALHLGPLSIHWYGISYLFGFLCVFLWMSRPAGRARLNLTAEQIQDFLVYALVGVLVGGRLFFVFADILSHHNPEYYFLHPLNIIAVWNGGMGFFGGLLGVIIAIAYYVRRHPGLSFGLLADEVVVMLPIGLASTRIVNFINDELPGDICAPDQPWCIGFPNYYGYRYPSQIFESVLDILVLPLMLLLSRYNLGPGTRAWIWFTCYGVTRSIAEIWRQSDIRVGPVTGGQLLSIPMIAFGTFMAVRAYKQVRKTQSIGPSIDPT